MRSAHQERIKKFMELAGQKVPDKPEIPDAKTRILRARLILEEAFETVDALGVDVSLIVKDDEAISIQFNNLLFEECGEPDLQEIADGCGDVSVVTIGTLLACGIQDVPLLEEIDAHNLRKFGPGGYRAPDGKWIKPKDLQPPDIAGVLDKQRGRGE